MRILVVSPHLDDAAFSLSLAIRSWLHRNHTVDVINCFTQSEYAPYSDAESMPRNARRTYVTTLRLKEDENWRKKLGPGLQTSNWSLEDAPLRLHCGVDQVCSLIPVPTDKCCGTIRTATEKALGQTGAALVVPLALGGHVDHRTVHDSLLPLAHENPNRPLAFYEDLPYAARAGAEDEIERVIERMGGELRPAFSSARSDIESAALWKRRLAFWYDSQIDDRTAEQIGDFCRRYGGRERMWGNKAWLATDLTVREHQRFKVARH
jgi:LmbE family N-acetylglucosaminyl deacetylase